MLQIWGGSIYTHELSGTKIPPPKKVIIPRIESAHMYMHTNESYIVP